MYHTSQWWVLGSCVGFSHESCSHETCRAIPKALSQAFTLLLQMVQPPTAWEQVLPCLCSSRLILGIWGVMDVEVICSSQEKTSCDNHWSLQPHPNFCMGPSSRSSGHPLTGFLPFPFIYQHNPQTLASSTKYLLMTTSVHVREECRWEMPPLTPRRHSPLCRQPVSGSGHCTLAGKPHSQGGERETGNEDIFKTPMPS